MPELPLLVSFSLLFSIAVEVVELYIDLGYILKVVVTGFAHAVEARTSYMKDDVIAFGLSHGNEI